MVSVTRVEAAPDLRDAKVFVSVLGGADEKRKTMIALRDASGFVRKSLRRSVTLRSVPRLEFSLDESIERGAEISRLIEEAAASSVAEGES
jgi:ribosome-binding factor A